MKHDRDYIMPCEENLASRMKAGESISEGLAFKVTAQKPGAAYRTYRKDGVEDHGKKYRGTMYDVEAATWGMW